MIEARRRGQPVWAETCPHFLIFTEAPPLRDEATQSALWSGLTEGHISVVATDDCAFSLASKTAGADNFDLCPEGMPGIEPRLTLLYSEGVARGRLSLPQMVNLLSTTPAELFGLAPKKGSLTPGSDADIHMASDYTAYEGVKVTGKVSKVFSRGDLIVDGEDFLAEPGRGEFVACSPSA